jgi:hypothetical protein
MPQAAHRGRRVVVIGLSFAEVGLHQCPSGKQGQTASGRTFSRPEAGPTGATAATLADSVRGTLLRRTPWLSKGDWNRGSHPGHKKLDTTTLDTRVALKALGEVTSPLEHLAKGVRFNARAT